MTYPEAYARAAAQIACAMSLLLASCNTARPVADARPNAELVAPPVPLDTGTVLVKPPRTLFQKVTGQPAAPAYRLPASTPVRIGKKSQVTIIHGSGNTVGQTGSKANSATGTGAKLAVAGKKAQQATDSATLQVATNAVAGRGNTATQTATTQQAKDWKAELASPVGKTVALLAAVVALAAFGGICYYLWPLLPKRKKSEPLA